MKGRLDITSKTCSKCQTEFDTNQFDTSLRNSDGYDYWCRLCRRNYTKQHYKDNIDKSRKRNNARRAARVEWLANIKRDKPCEDCGAIYEPYCMDFDHLGNKIKCVSRMVLENIPKKIVLEEIQKCDLVCVLCHNNRTRIRLDKKYENEEYTKRIGKSIEIINKAKSIPCKICGKSYKPHNMQFDHIDPKTKYRNISQLKNCAVKTLLAEIEKCQVLCALCHRRKSIVEQRARHK